MGRVVSFSGLLTCICVFFLPAMLVSGAVVIEYDDNKPTAIKGLMVGGDLYDVKFLWGKSFEQIQSGNSQPMIFNTVTAAETAVSAIVVALNDEAPITVPWYHAITVPYDVSDELVYYTGTRTLTEPIWLAPHIGTRFLHYGLNEFAFTEFTSSAPIPEPTSLLIWSGIALGGLGLAYRRRRKQAA